MRIAVIGAGSLGSIYGGNLARVGLDVSLLDVWAEHVECIQKNGLHIHGLTGDFTVWPLATTVVRDIPAADMVLVCVNAFSTLQAATAAAAILKSDGYCVTLQNGVGNIETLSETLGPARVMAGLSFQSGELEAPGHVRHTNNGPTYLGELDGCLTSRLAALTVLFSSSSMNPQPMDDIITTIWAKFVHNCGINAICAITGLRPGELQNIPEMMEFQTRIIGETLALIQAKGITLPEDDPAAAIREYCAHKYHKPSMMQHLERNQRTEIDSLNGYVARESARFGLSAPANEALAMLIKGREHQDMKNDRT